MHYFIFANKDSYITEASPSHIIIDADTVDKNYGHDEILELGKEFANLYSTSSYNTSRVLIQFDYSDISSSIVNQYITDPKFYLRLYETEGQQELSKDYSLLAFPLSQSWEEGVGKKFDKPYTKKGVTWKDYNSGSAWSLGNFNADSGSRTTGGGVWMTGSGYQASQSFSNQSPDVEMDVTDIVNKHLGGNNKINNFGFVLKFDSSTEADVSLHDFKFFSRHTHTIYAPTLEVRWDDHTAVSGSNTGSLNSLTMNGEIKNHIFIKGLQKTYRESEKVRFRVGCRKEFVQKTFTESVQTSSFYIPEGTGFYSIVDVNTNTVKIPFSAYTSMSCDTNSMYFDQWFNTFEPGRYYKILFKLKYDDGQEIIYDNNGEFKII